MRLRLTGLDPGGWHEQVFDAETMLQLLAWDPWDPLRLALGLPGLSSRPEPIEALLVDREQLRTLLKQGWYLWSQELTKGLRPEGVVGYFEGHPLIRCR